MSRVHPWFCCTQQNVDEISLRHCDGEQHGAPLVPAHVEPALAHIEHTPLLHVRPEQQSPSLAQVWFIARQAHVPLLQTMLPQQSALLAQWLPPAAHAQWPPVHARPSQQSVAVAHVSPDALQQ